MNRNNRPADRFATGTSQGIRLEATNVLGGEGKIAAIKFVREKTGLGLAQAKAYVEALAAGRNPDDAARAVPASSAGCYPILLIALVIVGAIIWWLTR